MIRATKQNDEVLVAQGAVIQLGRPDIQELKAQSNFNERRRIRICAHPDPEDRLHEMFIVHRQGAYIRPHKHFNKTESVHVLEGLAVMILFDEAGGISEAIPIGDYSSGRTFYYRMTEPCFHTLWITSDYLVFHEITNGPFRRHDTVFPPWA